MALLVAAGPAAAAPAAPTVAVRRAPGEIHLDGDLSDPGWQGAASSTSSTRPSPATTCPPKVRTVVWLSLRRPLPLHRARVRRPRPGADPRPLRRARRGLRHRRQRRRLPRHPQRRPAPRIELRVNPRGIQGDAIFNDATGNEDFSPDFFYDTAARDHRPGLEGGDTASPSPRCATRRRDAAELGHPASGATTRATTATSSHSRADPARLQLPRLPRAASSPASPACPRSRGTRRGALRERPATWTTRRGRPGQPRATPSERRRRARREVEPSAARRSTRRSTPTSRRSSPTSRRSPSTTASRSSTRRSAPSSSKASTSSTRRSRRSTPAPSPPRAGAPAPPASSAATSYTVLAADDRGGGSVILPGPTGSDFAPQDFGSIVGIGRVRHDFGIVVRRGALHRPRDRRRRLQPRRSAPTSSGGPAATDRVSGQFLWSETETPDRPDLAAEWDGRTLSGHGLDAVLEPPASARPIWRCGTATSRRLPGRHRLRPPGRLPRGHGRAGWNLYPEGLVRRRADVIVGYSEDRDGAPCSSGSSSPASSSSAAGTCRPLPPCLDSERTRRPAALDDQPRVRGPGRPLADVHRASASQGTVGEAVDLANVQVGTGPTSPPSRRCGPAAA